MYPYPSFGVGAGLPWGQPGGGQPFSPTGPGGLGPGGAIAQCGAPPDLSGGALKAYATKCGEDVAAAYVAQETGIDPRTIVKGGKIDWIAVGGAVASYELGGPVDPKVWNPDGSPNWNTIVKDAGAIGAAAFCTAYGAGAAAPVCGAIGGEVATILYDQAGKPLYDAGKAIVNAVADVASGVSNLVSDIFGSDDDPPPKPVTEWYQPSRFGAIRAVVAWYYQVDREYALNLVAARFITLAALGAVEQLRVAWEKRSGTAVTFGEMLGRFRKAGLELLPGWQNAIGWDASRGALPTAATAADERTNLPTPGWGAGKFFGPGVYASDPKVVRHYASEVGVALTMTNAAGNNTRFDEPGWIAQNAPGWKPLRQLDKRTFYVQPIVVDVSKKRGETSLGMVAWVVDPVRTPVFNARPGHYWDLYAPPRPGFAGSFAGITTTYDDIGSSSYTNEVLVGVVPGLRDFASLAGDKQIAARQRLINSIVKSTYAVRKELRTVRPRATGLTLGKAVTYGAGAVAVTGAAIAAYRAYHGLKVIPPSVARWFR